MYNIVFFFHKIFFYFYKLFSIVKFQQSVFKKNVKKAITIFEVQVSTAGNDEWKAYN